MNDEQKKSPDPQPTYSAAEQFAQLPTESLIGGPLAAAIRVQTAATEQKAEFIGKAGLPSDTNAPGSIAFTIPDGQRIEVPLLSIVPLPYLAVDTVDIRFEMKIATDDTDEESHIAHEPIGER